MVTLGIDYDVRPGQQEPFEDLARQVLAVLDQVPGHRETRVYRDIFRLHSYLIRSEWASREDLVSFTHSQRFREVQGMGTDLLLGPPRHEIYVRESEPLRPSEM